MGDQTDPIEEAISKYYTDFDLSFWLLLRAFEVDSAIHMKHHLENLLPPLPAYITALHELYTSVPGFRAKLLWHKANIQNQNVSITHRILASAISSTIHNQLDRLLQSATHFKETCFFYHASIYEMAIKRTKDRLVKSLVLLSKPVFKFNSRIKETSDLVVNLIQGAIDVEVMFLQDYLGDLIDETIVVLIGENFNAFGAMLKNLFMQTKVELHEMSVETMVDESFAELQCKYFD